MQCIFKSSYTIMVNCSLKVVINYFSSTAYTSQYLVTTYFCYSSNFQVINRSRVTKSLGICDDCRQRL